MACAWREPALSPPHCWIGMPPSFDAHGPQRMDPESRVRAGEMASRAYAIGLGGRHRGAGLPRRLEFVRRQPAISGPSGPLLPR